MFHSVLWYVSMCDVDSDLKVKEKAFSPTLTSLFYSTFKTEISLLCKDGSLFTSLNILLYLLSRIYPSTLCSSFPKRPHGLKFK